MLWNIILLRVFKGGGGGGFRPIIFETLIMRYGLKGKGRTCPDFFQGGFGSMRTILHMCSEASEQNMGPNTKILTKRDSALI